MPWITVNNQMFGICQSMVPLLVHTLHNRPAPVCFKNAFAMTAAILRFKDDWFNFVVSLLNMVSDQSKFQSFVLLLYISSSGLTQYGEGLRLRHPSTRSDPRAGYPNGGTAFLHCTTSWKTPPPSSPAYSYDARSNTLDGSLSDRPTS